MTRDGFIFYASFYEAMKCLDEATYNAVSRAINEYALYGNEIELTGVAKGFFALIKPQIDANNKRYENGKKGAEYGKLGGRPKKQNPEETPKKPLKNPEETPKEKDKVKDKEKVKDKDYKLIINENDIAEIVPKNQKEPKRACGEFENVFLTISESKKLFELYGEQDTIGIVNYLSGYKVEKNYKTKSDYLTIKRWVASAYFEQIKRNGNGNNANGSKTMAERVNRIVELGDALANM